MHVECLDLLTTHITKDPPSEAQFQYFSAPGLLFTTCGTNCFNHLQLLAESQTKFNLLELFSVTDETTATEEDR